MTIDRETDNLTQPLSRRARLRAALRPARLRSGMRRLLPYVATVAVTLLALLAYDQLREKPTPLTTGDVNTIITTAMAEVTPMPAQSAEAYQIILPSLVFIAIQGAPPREGGGNISTMSQADPGPALLPTDGRARANAQEGDDIIFGSGVIISGDGAILTAL
ncbi:MAG: hypothetical protein KDD83_13945, partial [Caldilineaceae bacterium]|nr:hypothetical protein [Caldilineaceae bacterium]